MLELIFQGFLEWAYGLALECWQYFSTALLDIMSMDFAYLKSHAPVVDEIMQILLAVGWALLIGNLVFQALKSMAVGLGFEGEDPKLLFARTFVFAFLLLASPQICEIGLSMTSKIIELLQIPDAVNVTFVDESVFGAIGAAWLLVIIFGIIVMFKVFKLLLEIAERYVILAMLTITAPLAFAMGGSKSTSEIFTGWCRMFGSMCLLMVTNVIFFKMLLSVLATVPSGLDVLPWIVLILTIVKVARKADAIVTRIGLNPAITGDSLGRGLPGTLTYMVVRSAASQITKAVGKSAGNGGKGAAPNAPSGGPRMGGPSGGHGNTAEDGRQSAAQQSSTNQSTSQKSSDAQSASVHTGAPQSPSQEKSAPSAAQDSMPKNSTAPRPSQERKSSVPLGTRRSPTHIKAAIKIPPVGAQNASGRPGTAGKAGASARPSVAGASKRRALPSLAAHESTFARDNAARPCRNAGSTIRFPYESDKRTKSTGWSNWSGDAGRRAHRDHGGTNHREHFAGQLSKTCGGDWWRDAYHRLCSRRNTDRAATYTQCALYAAATQADNRSGIAASGGKPAPRYRRNAKRRFCAAAVWRTATRQEWYSKPHGSFSGCTAA